MSGKTAKRNRRALPFLSRGKYREKDPRTDERGMELCVACDKGSQWDVGNSLGRRRMQTSPFRIVATPHGKRVIHDYCLWQLQQEGK